MSNLFEAAGLEEEAPRPLADRLRPKSLREVVGQDHLVGPGGPIGRMVTSDRLASAVLWGPPGTGKTTIARLISQESGFAFEQVSAVFSGVAELRKVFEGAKMRRQTGQGTLLFVDEIHRFNRAQQDSFLPYVEDGTVVLIGATTENPSFELNAALLSRAQVLVLNRLDDGALELLLQRAEKEMGRTLALTPDARETLRIMADGDGRYVINLAEMVFALLADAPLDSKALVATLQKRAPVYDKGQEEHYNLISALHKSVRGSDANAALYWLGRMLAGGEDPMYILRRMVRMAIEDIGLADPDALVHANAAKQCYEFLGSPEGDLALGQLVIYLATAPKSNAAYSAFGKAKKAAREHGSLMPPKNILNAPTKLMGELGYGDGYVYEHGEEDHVSGQRFFPEEMTSEEYYEPRGLGFEKEIVKRLAYWKKQRLQKQAETDDKT